MGTASAVGLHRCRSLPTLRATSDHEAFADFPSRLHNRAVRLGSTITEELPYVSHFSNQIEIHVRNHDVVGISRPLGHDLAARITEIALSIELADLPRLFDTGPIDRADKILVGNRVRRLFQLPKIFA